MYRYNLYIIKHLTSSVALITVSLTSIIWLTQALRFIDFIVHRGISFLGFLELTLLLVPSLMLFILPTALLCSVLVVYYRLMMDSELLVLSGAGLSRFQVARPALYVSLGVSMLSYVISLYLLPVSYHEFKNLQSYMRDSYATLLLQEDVFNSPVEGLTVYIRDRNKNGDLHGILVHDSRDEKHPPITMMAEEGRIEDTPQGSRFVLRKGNRQQIDNGKVSFLDFDQYALDLAFYNGTASNRYQQPEELFINQLLYPDPTNDDAERLIAEGHNRLSWPLFPVALALFTTSVLLTGEFNRRGQWQRIVFVVVVAGLSLTASVGLLSLAVKHSWMIALMYVNPAMLMLYGTWRLAGVRLGAPPRKVEA